MYAEAHPTTQKNVLSQMEIGLAVKELKTVFNTIHPNIKKKDRPTQNKVNFFCLAHYQKPPYFHQNRCGSTFGTTKCRRTDISKFQNFVY